MVLEKTNTQHIIQKLIIWETKQAEKTVHGIELDIKKDYWISTEIFQKLKPIGI